LSRIPDLISREIISRFPEGRSRETNFRRPGDISQKFADFPEIYRFFSQICRCFPEISKKFADFPQKSQRFAEFPQKFADFPEFCRFLEAFPRNLPISRE
jgi:hypothetical protein